MLIIALVLAVVSLAALVTAVVTSNELIAWVCIGFSALGVLLLVIDAVRDRNRRATAAPSPDAGERTEVIPPVLDSDAEFDEAEFDEAEFDEDALHADEADDEADEVGADADEADADYDDEALHADEADDEAEEAEDEGDADEADDPELTAELAVEDHPDEVVYDDPDHDIPSDDEPVYPVAAEEAAIHTVTDEYLAAQDDPESEIESYVADAESGRTPEEPGESDESDTVIDSDDTSYTVLESPTVSPAADSASDAAIVTTPDETDVTGSEESEERGGER